MPLVRAKCTNCGANLEVDRAKDAAICPYCGMDSVIGESSGYPITKEFLQKMQEHWFGH